jgi:hypothetical protein
MKLGIISALVFSLAAAACSPTASLTAPAGFAALRDHDTYQFRATSAQGVVVAARAEPNTPSASLDFWARAIDLRLKRDGYIPDAERPVKTTQGIEGRELRYTRADRGRTMRYWLTVFTTEKRVYLVEAGGDKEDFDLAQGDVERAISSLRTN